MHEDFKKIMRAFNYKFFKVIQISKGFHICLGFQILMFSNTSHRNMCFKEFKFFEYSYSLKKNTLLDSTGR